MPPAYLSPDRINGPPIPPRHFLNRKPLLLGFHLQTSKVKSPVFSDGKREALTRYHARHITCQFTPVQKDRSWAIIGPLFLCSILCFMTIAKKFAPKAATCICPYFACDYWYGLVSRTVPFYRRAVLPSPSLSGFATASGSNCPSLRLPYQVRLTARTVRHL